TVALDQTLVNRSGHNGRGGRPDAQLGKRLDRVVAQSDPRTADGDDHVSARRAAMISDFVMEDKRCSLTFFCRTISCASSQRIAASAAGKTRRRVGLSRGWWSQWCARA